MFHRHSRNGDTTSTTDETDAQPVIAPRYTFRTRCSFVAQGYQEDTLGLCRQTERWALGPTEVLAALPPTSQVPQSRGADDSDPDDQSERSCNLDCLFCTASRLPLVDLVARADLVDQPLHLTFRAHPVRAGPVNRHEAPTRAGDNGAADSRDQGNARPRHN